MKRLTFFLPNQRCPRRCIYCDQGAITGIPEIPSPDEVREQVRTHAEPVEICYFGGSFTCFPTDQMRSYLDCVREAPPGSKVRFSTHPLGISSEITAILGKYPISVAELGIASFDDDVLAACGRGYDRALALKAVSFLIGEGFLPGIQIMVGLPGQKKDPLLSGLREIAVLKGSLPIPLRIYPCLVLGNTALEKRWRDGTYVPLSLDEAVRWAGELTFEAENLGFNVIRVGLHETPSLARSVLAGPHHPALGEMARGHALILSLVAKAPQGPWIIPSKDISLLTGHGGRGLRTLSDMTGLFPDQARNRLSLIPSPTDKKCRSRR